MMGAGPGGPRALPTASALRWFGSPPPGTSILGRRALHAIPAPAVPPSRAESSGRGRKLPNIAPNFPPVWPVPGVAFRAPVGGP